MARNKSVEIDVSKELTEIKKLLTEGGNKSDAAFSMSVGLFAMALALTFIPVVPNYASGIVLFIGGLVALIVGLRQYNKRKST
ncbi:hypothetical protein ACFLU0_00670 [Chloroflexota bacterium]